MRNTITTLLHLSALFLCSQVMAYDPISKADCQKDYLDLFSKSEINVTAAFGYFDFEDHTVGDADGLQTFIGTLTSDCKSWDKKMCGFKVISTNPHVLTKKVMGPDGSPRTLKITTDASSISTDDKANRSNPKQTDKTARVKKMFLDGLENSEVTVYMGHSRDGGGPDFGPPRLRANGHVDYPWYHEHPIHKQAMEEALQKEPNKSRIITLVSCSSVRWFSKGIARNAPATGLIGTDALFYTSQFEQAVPFLEKIFSYQCLKKFSVPDANHSANVISKRPWKVPVASKEMTSAHLVQETLKELIKYLSSPDKETRKLAFKEIKSFDSKLYSDQVWKELKNYEFGNKLLSFK